jgi:predicted Zn-dependent peptidase
MKKLFFLPILILGFSGAGILHSFDTAQLSLTKNITETVLPNGLKVIIKEEKSIPLVGLSVTYKVGFRNEDTNGRTGLTHLLEHMQFKGSTNYKKGEIAKTLSDAERSSTPSPVTTRPSTGRSCPPGLSKRR